jgi:hypothetical protein
LKAAQELEANEDYQDGLEAGRRWAKDDATPKQLRRISNYVNADHGSVDWWDVDSPHWRAPFGATDVFVFKAWPDRNGDRHAAADFWETALGEDARHRIEDADFFRGFGEGVAEIWGQGEDKL